MQINFQNILKNIKGDRSIWAVVLLLALGSFIPVYSASTNLVYVVGNGTTTGIILKHVVGSLGIGFVIMYFVHKFPYRYFGGVSRIMMMIVALLLFGTMLKGTVIGGANAARWITIPIVGLSFQPSALAGLVLMVFTARYLARRKDQEIDFWESFRNLWLPVGLVLMLILPANFSTTALFFLNIIGLCFVGGYPKQHIVKILGAGIGVLVLFIVLSKAAPGLLPNRVDTWMSRIESFKNKDKEEGYQVENAKIAIATGGVMGLGPGKSVQKNFLPQSTSDFIFAILVEETGLVGAFFVIGSYVFLLFRIYIASKNAGTVFGSLLVLGVGLPIILQSIVNMMVATNLGPVTGQTLPLISSGGTSIWITCIALGIILSVTASKEVTELDLANQSDDPLEKLYIQNEQD